MNHAKIFLPTFAMALVGCNAAPENNRPRTEEPAINIASAAATAIAASGTDGGLEGGTPFANAKIFGMGPIATAPGDRPGFSFDFARSKVRMGDAVGDSVDQDSHRYAGSLGSYHTMRNGFQRGLPNNSSAGAFDPVGTSEEHRKLATDYFLGLGMPADQVARVQTGAVQRQTGTAAAGVLGAPETRAQITGFSRAIDGVTIFESFAWVNIDPNGVVGESIWWPPIAASALAEATKLKAVLADPQQRGTFVKAVPDAADSTVEVVIHHAHYLAPAFWVRATIDVKRKSGTQARRSFDADGNIVAVTLTETQAAGVATP